MGRRIIRIYPIFLLVLVVFSSNSLLAKIQQENKFLPQELRTSQSLDGTWKISKPIKQNTLPDLTGEMKTGYWKREVDTTIWDDISVPMKWHEVNKWTYPCDISKPYWFANFRESTYISGWYRRDFEISESFKGSSIFIHFDCVAYEAHLFINGNKVGMHRGGFTDFEFDITDFVDFDGRNSLALWVYNDFGENPVRHVYGKMFGAYANMGGIEGPVKIVIKPQVSIKRVLINPRINSSTLEIEYWIENSTKEIKKYSLFALISPFVKDSVSTAVKESGSTEIDLGIVEIEPGIGRHTIEFEVKDLKYWWPQEPHLYNLYLILKDGDRIGECKYERFGYREFVARGTKFYLNNQRVRLYAGNILTYGMFPVFTQEGRERFRKDIERQKKYGVNILRYHMAGPDASMHLQVADEAGIMMMDEWAWFHRVEGAIHDPKARQIFLDNNDREMREWIYRDYNYPSLVIWSLSNEVWSQGEVELLNHAHENCRPLDKSGRPMSVDSGFHSVIKDMPVKTDIYDDHNYTMNSTHPWTLLQEVFDNHFQTLEKIYGKVDKPWITFECLSLDNTRLSIPLSQEIGPERFLELCKTHGVREIGLRAAADPDRGYNYMVNKVGKEVLEEFRKETRIQGFHPWWGNRSALPEVLKSIYTPLFICIDDLRKNLFAGDEFKANIVLIKDPEEAKILSVLVEVIDRGGKQLISDRFQVSMETLEEKRETIYSWKIPPDTETGFYNLVLKLSENDKQVCQNQYQIFILNKINLRKEIETKEKVALFQFEDGQSQNGYNIRTILDELRIKYTLIRIFDNLKDFTVVILGNNKKGEKEAEEQTLTRSGGAIRNWLENGGRLLSFENEQAMRIPWLRNYEMVCGDGMRQPFVNIVVPEHPAFEGLVQDNFDYWNGDNGLLIDSGINPLSLNVLAAIGTYSRHGALSAVIGARIGKGECLISQLKAVERYNEDSVSTKYVQNLLQYFLVKKTSDKVREIVELEDSSLVKEIKRVLPEYCFIVDIKKYVNMGFKDEVEGDQRGGWVDAGSADLRHAPVGQQQFYGISFEIINPDTNDGKSCLVLKGNRTPFLPVRMDGIKVDKKAAKLFFLHTTYYMKQDKIGKYTVHCGDGTEIEIILEGGKNIGDWYNPFDLEESVVAWVKEHPVNNISYGFNLTQWINPYPDKTITTIDFSSEGYSTPILLAISGVRYIDWAMEELNNPWDMDSSNDISEFVENSKELEFKDGIMSFTSTGPHTSFSLNLGGKSINATRFNKILFRLFSSNTGNIQIAFFSNYNKEGSFTTMTPSIFTVEKGWKIYEIDLDEEIWRGKNEAGKYIPWGGTKGIADSLRIDQYTKEATQIKIDWVKLTPK